MWQNEGDAGDISDETVSGLRRRLDTMKSILGDDADASDSARRKRAAKRKGNCLDSIIDGSFMGLVLGVCLTMVLGAAFFAYKNLYFAVLKKIYPESQSEL